jgi:hypothetical protein
MSTKKFIECVVFLVDFTWVGEFRGISLGFPRLGGGLGGTLLEGMEWLEKLNRCGV